MSSNSQSAFYSHDLPLNYTGGEFKIESSEYADVPNEAGLGVYMYLMETTGESFQAVDFETVSKYLDISFIDGEGSAMQSQLCEAAHFNGSNLGYDANKTIYDMSENQINKAGLICPDTKNMTGIDPLNLRLEVRTLEGDSYQKNQFFDFIYSKILVTKIFTKKMDFKKAYDTVDGTGSYFH